MDTSKLRAVIKKWLVGGYGVYRTEELQVKGRLCHIPTTKAIKFPIKFHSLCNILVRWKRFI